MYYIFDTETASLQGGVCELAYIKIDKDLNVLEEFCSYVNPERKIEDGARAIHGITDDKVCEAPTLADLRDANNPLFAPGIVGVGHNVSFDLRMLKGYVSTSVALCTLKLARQHLNQPSNKLEDLQTALGLPKQKSHSALGDVHTCRDLLEHLVKVTETPLLTLIERSLEPKMVNKMPFGKHKGKAVAALPRDYRNWLQGQDIDKDLAYTLKKLENI